LAFSSRVSDAEFIELVLVECLFDLNDDFVIGGNYLSIINTFYELSADAELSNQ